MIVKLLSPVGSRVSINKKVYYVPGVYDISNLSLIPASVKYTTNPGKTRYKIITKQGVTSGT